ncbi:MAG: ATP-binding protein [Planctomycetes bacterium]|nr:ATP-binding protein [Planctomycetota bacterium]
MKLDVKVEKNSILKNITHFFSKEDSYIQELLQNARRAEAARVSVNIDTKAFTLNVHDDGHGVADPQSLLDIGKSEWAEGIKLESPAGMGFFSVFKLGDKASIRSRRFELTIDIAELRRGGQAQLVESLPEVKGTTITVYSDAKRLLDGRSINEVSAEHMVERWKKEAKWMPFATSISLNGAKADVVPAFDPRKWPEDCLLRVERPWGYIDVMTGEARWREDRDLLVSQGVAVSLKSKLLVRSRALDDSISFRVLCRPGTVNFTLPDRDSIIEDDKLTALLDEVQAALIQGAIDGVAAAEPAARRKLASLVYAFDERRIGELSEDLQWVELSSRHEHYRPFNKAELSRMMALGSEVCVTSLDREEILEFVPTKVLMLRDGQQARFGRLFPTTRVVTAIELHVEPDKRGDTLWQVGKVKLAYCDGEVRHLPPVASTSLLTSNEFDQELVANDADLDCKRTDEHFIVLHSCPDEVTQPDLQTWHDYYEDDWSYSESCDNWRVSAQNLDIVRTLRGIPGRDVTFAEFEAVLRDKLKLGFGARISLRDASLSALGETFAITKATVVIAEDEKPTRCLLLEEVGERLEVVGETVVPEDTSAVATH